MSWRYIQTNGKTTLYSNNKNSLLFRHGSVTKKPSKTNNELSLLSKELAVLHAIAKLPMRLQTGALAELEELKNDEDTELEERRKEESEHEDENEDEKGIEDLLRANDDEDELKKIDDPDDAKLKAELESMNQSRYSVLEYHVGSIEHGDKFLMELGCS